MSDEAPGYTPGPRALYLCTRCDEREPGTGGPFDLPVPKNGVKPACPTCRARRWVNKQWSGFRVNVSGTGLTPTTHGSEANGRHIITAVDAMGPDLDRQNGIKSRTQHDQIHNPMAPRLGGANVLQSLIPGMPLSMPGQAGESRPIAGASRGITVAAGGRVARLDRVGKTNVVASYTGDGKK